jgi:GNAT superfamily N-acetyltransferase
VQTDALSVVDYSEQQWPLLRAFWLRVYGPRYALGLNRGLFEWQFGAGAGGVEARSLGGDGYHLKLALDDGQVVGTLGYIPTETVVRGHAVRGGWLANWIVAPELGNAGVGRQLMQSVLAELHAVVNVGISDAGQRQFARLGWHDLGTLARWVQALDPEGADTLLPEDATGTWPSVPVRARASGFSCRETREFGNDATRLWDDVWGAGGAGARRSAGMLNWRYAKHPTFRYEMVELREGTSLQGFAVYRIEQVTQPSVRIGRIVELVATDRAVADLIAAVSEHARSRGIVLLDFFCASRRLDAALLAQGFGRGDMGRALDIPYRFQPVDRRRGGIACVVHVDGGDMPRACDDWYVTKGDSDQDRPN